MGKRKQKWYHPKVETGWHAESPIHERRALVLKAHKGDNLAAGRSMQALANIQISSPNGSKFAAEEATKDAEYFFRKHEETGK